MKIEGLKLAYFSPTGTTKTIVQTIASGIGHSIVEYIDVTKPDIRKIPLHTEQNDLLVVAVPVYVGRIPTILHEWLDKMKVNGTPTACVVVYGNRAFDDALLELKDRIEISGGKPIACAAFVGEHSFSSTQTPIAVSRPDADDLRMAEMFGRRIEKNLHSMALSDDISEISVSGNYPYRELEEKLCVDFIATGDNCTKCGICAELCPAKAIDFEEYSSIDIEKCIVCCACIKGCPEQAKIMKEGKIQEISLRLSQMCKERKEPEFFFPLKRNT
jgi:ferredoxin/menaquinone-dependent protoporphyrinogen IX oxidase